MTTTDNRAFILTRMRELATAYEALQDQVARGNGAQVLGRRGGRGEAPTPISTAVVGRMTAIERDVLRHHEAAYTLLGWHLPTVRLAREGQWLPCPECQTNALRIDRQDWCVFCANPACRQRWRWGAEIELLGQILAEQGHDGAAVQARALEVAQGVADDLGADEPAEAGMEEARTA
jgi:hypothetical protein